MNQPKARRRSTPSLRPIELVSAVIALVVALLLSSLVPTPGLSGAGVSPAVLRPNAPIPPWNNWTCNPNNPSPAALEIPLQNPAISANASSGLTATLEFKVVGYVAADDGITLYLPTSKAVFPTSPSGSYSFTLPAKSLVVTGGNWSSPNLVNSTASLPVPETFSSGLAYLTTSKSAVMANATSGSLTLEFQWRWSLQPTGGSAVVTSPWSIPSLNASSPYLPSIFYPAPFVGLVSSSPSPAPAASLFTLTLDGTVANTSFRVVLEYPNNGTEIQSIWENSSAAVTFAANVPLAFPSGAPVPPGNYIVHVHDVCEAIVHMLALTVTAATPSGNNSGGGVGTYVIYGIVAVVVLAVLLGVVFILRRRRRRPANPVPPGS